MQILGAEKALFRALKTRKDTPKYGLIYHASLVGQTTAKNKGKVSDSCPGLPARHVELSDNLSIQSLFATWNVLLWIGAIIATLN